MVKYKKFTTSQPVVLHDLESKAVADPTSLDEVLQQVNEFLAENPERKLIKIEHLDCTAQPTGEYVSNAICLWYSE